jgi:hypothetical protein
MLIRSTALITMLGIAAYLTGCGSEAGGTEFGNPDQTVQVVTGEVDSSSSATVAKAAASAGGCVADTVVARNALDASTTAALEADCTFALSLKIDAAYRMIFLKNNALVGLMHFVNDSALLTDETFRVRKRDSAMALGRISFANTIGTPAVQPASLIDSDGDGLADADDTDDDGDAVSDSDEDDCDLDGFLDDDDSDSSTCTTALAAARIRRVTPHHDATFARIGRRVSLGADIKARVSCTLDATTVTIETFAVTAGNDTIDCTYAMSGSDQRIECDHDDDPFEADTIYTATLNGIRCADGTAVEARSWSWKTRSE